jgi:penicillin-binding protein 1C
MIRNDIRYFFLKSTTTAIVFFRKWLSVKMNRIVAILFSLIVFLFLLIPLPHFPEDYSMMILDTDGEILQVFLNKNQQWCLPPDPDLKILEKLKIAVFEYEDRWFRWHPGINPVAIIRALAQNTKSGMVKSGASTITMQVARLTRPKSRTIPNKIFEMIQALKLEALHSKGTILRQYLDHAPYGRNVVGIRAASLRFFGKTPESLSWAESATLAVLPNGPGLIAPGVRTELLKKKRDALLLRLARKGIIDLADYNLALLEKIPSISKSFPSCARHLTQELHGSADQDRFVLRTTIQKNLQERIEELVFDHAERMRTLGIRNASVLVVETQSGKVRAYVGSGDFFDSNHQGQVNGVLAPRSPGSLLKPFLYALAMDQGILLSQTEIKDVPSYYGAFSPSNASEKYDGLVTVKDALIRSLNVPAIRVLYTVGVDPFYHFLKTAGLQTLFRAPEEYGLPLILGGAEVTVWDMAVLFRGLGNGGCFRPLRVVEDEKTSNETSGIQCLISPGACFLTLNMLRELRRPEAEYYWNQYQNQWPIAWKTGTSYGQRDAWAAGVSPQWTIVVWIGNFDGEGNANLSGAPCAGTLLFSIHNSLPKKAGQSWFEPPVQDLDPVELCLETGYPAGPYCEKRQAVDAPRFMKPMKLCPYHRKLFLSTDGKEQVCSACWETGRVLEVNRLVYPPEVVQFLRENGRAVSEAPRHKRNCPSYTAEDIVQVLYPQNKSRLWVPRDLDGKLEKVTLRAAHRDRGSLLYWYLDDRYLGTSRNHHVFSCLLSKGAHILEVVDEDGNRAKVRFEADLREATE